MAFLQGKMYMFNMVVLIYIFLHSSKYSINTVNKPSHNVSLFSASGIFRGRVAPAPFGTRRSSQRPKQENKINPKPDIHTTNLQRQYKVIQHIKYEDV